MAEITNLEQVKKELYRQFNRAVERQEKYQDPDRATGDTQYSVERGTPENFAVQNRIAIGTLAQAIAAVEEALSVKVVPLQNR